MPLKEAKYREKILLYLAKNLNKNLTVNKIATDLKLFYSLVHKTIKDLEKQEILTIEKIGNYNLLKLDLNEHRTVLELALLSHKLKEQQEKEGKISNQTDRFIKKVSKEVISVILADKVYVVAINLSTNLEIASNTADFEVSLIQYGDFEEKLSDNEFSNNLLNGIILHGYENFWRMIAESR
ncbi:hypothetical protein ACFL6I_28055 [candidate division KSB1 bacterium]